MAMVEPFISHRASGRVVNELDPDSAIKSIHIAAGLGASSAYTWLKLPVVDEMDRVMAATTLPTLLLGGDPQGDPQDTYASWGRALDLPAVRGLVVGRALLYPPDGDVAAAVDIAAELGRTGAGSARERQRALGAPARAAPARRTGRVAIDDAVDGWSHTRLVCRRRSLPVRAAPSRPASGSTSSCRSRGSVAVTAVDAEGSTHEAVLAGRDVGLRRAHRRRLRHRATATSR